MPTKEKNEAAAALGRKGGQKTAKLKGKKHYKMMGKKSGEARRAKKATQ